jgi:hypothetical protein
MKPNFSNYIMHEREGELYDYIQRQEFSGWAYSVNWKYDTLVKKLLAVKAPQHIFKLLKTKYDEWLTPAPLLPTKEEQERLILDFIARFPDTPPSTTDDRQEFTLDGFQYHIRRSYLPNPHRNRDTDPLVTERDVEYWIEGGNHDLCRTNKEVRGWSCWVYMNRPGYMNSGRFPSITGTDVGVQWYRRR